MDSNFAITITNVVAANRLHNNITETSIRRQCRKHWAVMLKHAGKTWYAANGKQILLDNLHPVILPKGCSYSWRCVEPGECLIIEFDAEQTCTDVLPVSVSDSGFFVREFQHIQKHLHSAAPTAQIECIHGLYGLLLQLLKADTKKYVPKQKQQLLEPAIRYISENYYKSNITNDTLATLCGISTVYFRKCFETVYGVPPIRYLHNFRIRKAKDILSSDYESIGQVAESVGYTSVYHFSKMFKVYTNQSPTQYAKASRK